LAGEPFLLLCSESWLTELVARRTPQAQEIHLLVKMTVRRFKRGFIYLGSLN